MLFWGLAPSVPSDFCGRGPALSSSADVSLYRRGGSAVLGPRAMPSFLPSATLSLLAWVVGGGSIPSPAPSVLTRHSVSLGGHSGGFISPGQCVHSRGVDDLRRLESPSHSLGVPPGVFCYSGGLAASSVAPHFGGLARHSVCLALPPFASHFRGFAGRQPSPLPRLSPHGGLVGGGGGGVGGGAPAGRCAPWSAVHATFL